MAKESDPKRKWLLRGGLVLTSMGLTLSGCQEDANNEQPPVVIQPYQESTRLTEAESLKITKKNLHRVIDSLSSQNQDKLQSLKENLSKDLEDLEGGTSVLRLMSALGPDYARVVWRESESEQDKLKYEIGISVYKFSSGEFDVNEAILDLIDAYVDLQSSPVSK